MASLPIHWIQARTYCQATEVEERVGTALDGAARGGEGTRDRVEGQFGNPVLILTRRIERAADIRGSWQRWREARLLSELERDLVTRLDDDGILHFRVDKQAALQGTIRLAGSGDAIDIQVKLKAYPANRKEIEKVARALLAEDA